MKYNIINSVEVGKRQIFEQMRETNVSALKISNLEEKKFVSSSAVWKQKHFQRFEGKSLSLL